ncbi:transmembrane protein 214-A [Cephus cinctus]|uniref:Transmembrane protein 214-A n=1 Tax=Cephus cinctus TaxID=211228 RepID=A0AAJ7CBG2_CEPCN|nr:transmembrane protein 214-A [Cephus cinctus]
MSSGGWEVVGKGKKDKSNGKPTKLTKAEKKKFIENAPKVEDFLPLSQVKTLYDNLDGNKENKKPTKEKDNKTKENEEKKKQQKQKQLEQKKQEPKEKPPKSIEDAVNLINAASLESSIINDEVRYPDAPLIWLKNVDAFLNASIPIERDDPLFDGKPPGYPLSVVPKTIRSLLERVIERAGPQTVKLFYEGTLTAMATDMAKGTPVVGHKIFLQLLAQHDPDMTIANIPKLISLRKSYQNRKPIGQSLFWVLYQAGRKDLSVGLKAWHEIISPMLEIKNYSGYVVKVLNDMVADHMSNTNNVTPDMYLTILDDVYSGKLNIPATIVKEVTPVIVNLRSITFKNENANYRKLLETLFDKITLKISPIYRDELLHAVAACLMIDVRCYTTWKNIYSKHLYQSSVLLKHIDSNWSTIQPTLKKKVLSEVLASFQVSNDGWKTAKKKDEYLSACIKGCEVLVARMTVSRSWFPWKKGSLLLFLLISAIVAIDYRKHGSFEASSTGKFLKDSGILGQGQRAWSTTKYYSAKSLEYAEASAPEYYKTVVDVSMPYIKLGGDLYLVIRNASWKLYNNIAAYVAHNGPLVAASIDRYAPGLLEETRTRSIQALDFVKTYSALAAEHIVEYSTHAIRWLETNVFVGKLSPESLQKYASQAINTTQTFASQTYDWVYEKVQILSKVQ